MPKIMWKSFDVFDASDSAAKTLRGFKALEVIHTCSLVVIRHSHLGRIEGEDLNKLTRTRV